MWKLSIDKVVETEYLHKMLPGLTKRVKQWKVSPFYKSFRAKLLSDWSSDTPKDTGTLEKLLIAKPAEAYALNKQLMSDLVPNYEERVFTGKSLPTVYKKRLKVLENVFDYDGRLSGSESKSYWLAGIIGHNTCTYCNRQYTFTVSGKNNNERITRPAFDHWFPKSMFPLLSLNLYNLIPCCTICNSGAKGDSVFKLGEYIHPYLQDDDDPHFKFIPAVSDSDEKEWHIVLDRDVDKNPDVDNTIKAFALDRIYDLHGPLEVKEIMDFATAYNKTYLLSVYSQLINDLGGIGYSQEEVYRMLFGAESIPSKYLDRPLSKMKHDILEYLHII